jgi:hypothetical protein
MSLLRSRLFLALLAFFGLSDWADTKLDPNWHWHDVTRQPFGEWVRQVPLQLPVRIAQGLKFPVDWTVTRLAADSMPWYSQVFARTIGAGVLYAILLRFVWWRMRARFGWAPSAGAA